MFHIALEPEKCKVKSVRRVDIWCGPTSWFTKVVTLSVPLHGTFSVNTLSHICSHIESSPVAPHLMPSQCWLMSSPCIWENTAVRVIATPICPFLCSQGLPFTAAVAHLCLHTLFMFVRAPKPLQTGLQGLPSGTSCKCCCSTCKLRRDSECNLHMPLYQSSPSTHPHTNTRI